MYAVSETGGKQYRVELGTELAVERLDATPGTSIDFDRVLLVAEIILPKRGSLTLYEARQAVMTSLSEQLPVTRQAVATKPLDGCAGERDGEPVHNRRLRQL